MEKEIGNIKKIVSKVDGWLTENEGITLYSLSRKCTGRGVIVEIGSWQGKSTIWLAKGSKMGNKAKVYSIDPHTGSSEHKKTYGKVWTFDKFKSNIRMAKVNDLVIPIVGMSEKVVKNFDKPVEFIFIDGAHEYELVKLDYEIWFPKVIEKGTMAFHDTIGHLGPKRLVEEMVFKSRHFKNVKFADYSITYGVKVEENSFFDRIRNRYVLLLKNFCEFSYKIKLPKPLIFALRKIIRVIH